MENIEAMLCAFIEGDLDEAGRAEIEKHLRDHPQHRKLISELIATRDLVRNLPRATAPSDVGEGLRGQVERSILLDDQQSTASASRMRINRWPQIGAVAAVLLLTGGLGIVVIRTVLPTFHPPMFAQMTPQDTGTDSTDLPGNSSTDASQPAPGASPSRAMAKDKAAILRDAALMLHSNEIQRSQQSDLADLQRDLQSSGYASAMAGGGAMPVYLVIDSSDPSTTNDKIAHFLNSNGISWMPIPDSQLSATTRNSPEQDDVTGPPTTQRTDQLATRLAPSATTQNSAAQQPGLAQQNGPRDSALQDHSDKPAEHLAMGTNPGATTIPDAHDNRQFGYRDVPAMQKALQPTSATGNGVADSGAVSPTTMSSGMTSGTTTEPTQPGTLRVGNDTAIAPAVDRQPQGIATTQQSLATAVQRDANPSRPDAPIQHVYVARRMTLQQADALRAALAAQQSAPVLLVDSQGVPTTQRSPLASNDTPTTSESTKPIAPANNTDNIQIQVNSNTPDQGERNVVIVIKTSASATTQPDVVPATQPAGNE